MGRVGHEFGPAAHALHRLSGPTSRVSRYQMLSVESAASSDNARLRIEDRIRKGRVLTTSYGGGSENGIRIVAGPVVLDITPS